MGVISPQQAAANKGYYDPAAYGPYSTQPMQGYDQWGNPIGGAPFAMNLRPGGEIPGDTGPGDIPPPPPPPPPPPVPGLPAPRGGGSPVGGHNPAPRPIGGRYIPGTTPPPPGTPISPPMVADINYTPYWLTQAGGGNSWFNPGIPLTNPGAGNQSE